MYYDFRFFPLAGVPFWLVVFFTRVRFFRRLARVRLLDRTEPYNRILA